MPGLRDLRAEALLYQTAWRAGRESLLVLHPKQAVRGWACPACQIKNEGRTCSRCGTRKATKRTSISARCDSMAAWLCKALAGFKCARCSKPGTGESRTEGLEWSHRVKRRMRATRWAMDNCDALCHECHQWFETRPLAYAQFWRLKGASPEDLERRANEPWDKDYGAILAYLQPLVLAMKERLKA